MRRVMQGLLREAVGLDVTYLRATHIVVHAHAVPTARAGTFGHGAGVVRRYRNVIIAMPVADQAA